MSHRYMYYIHVHMYNDYFSYICTCTCTCLHSVLHSIPSRCGCSYIFRGIVQVAGIFLAAVAVKFLKPLWLFSKSLWFFYFHFGMYMCCAVCHFLYASSLSMYIYMYIYMYMQLQYVQFLKMQLHVNMMYINGEKSILIALWCHHSVIMANILMPKTQQTIIVIVCDLIFKKGPFPAKLL